VLLDARKQASGGPVRLSPGFSRLRGCANPSEGWRRYRWPIMPLRAVIFDLDETLLDSSALLSDRDARRWGRVFERLDEVLPFVVAKGETDVAELPRLAAERGLKVGLLTHSPREYARELLSAHGISVEVMVTGSDGYAPKPDPAGLRAVMAELGVEPADTLYLGDSVGDFGAAASAGTVAAGVAWAEATPAAWRHGWPDFAIAAPRRLLQLIDGEEGLGSWAEAVASGQSPRVHWGSLMRLGNGVYGLGRYFPMGDRRFPAHDLSHLVLRAKDDPTAAADVAQIFKSLAENATSGPRPELILSVPPEADGYDRFALARAALAKAWGAHDGGGLLTMRYGVENYKHVARHERASQNLDRFVCAPLQGERVVLIDDVLTSGGQSDASREAIKAAGGGPVTILVLSVTQDSLPEQCPLCDSNLRTFRRHSDGREFIGCTAFFHAGCEYTRDIR
jgi:HAD superfamily hydrolase (TIGR01549 family)